MIKLKNANYIRNACTSILFDYLFEYKYVKLRGALEGRRWSFSAFEEELKSNGDDDADVENLSFNGGAQA